MKDAAPNLPRPHRAPQFVSRRTAAALLDLSGSGFNQWVKRGLLPPPAAGTPLHERRWCWAEIVAWMRGDRSSAPRNLFGEQPPLDIGHQRGPKAGAPNAGRPSKRSQAKGAANGRS